MTTDIEKNFEEFYNTKIESVWNTDEKLKYFLKRAFLAGHASASDELKALVMELYEELGDAGERFAGTYRKEINECLLKHAEKINQIREGK